MDFRLGGLVCQLGLLSTGKEFVKTRPACRSILGLDTRRAVIKNEIRCWWTSERRSQLGLHDVEQSDLSTASEEMLDESTSITARAGIATGACVGTPVETFPDAGEAAPAVFLVCELVLRQFLGLGEGPVFLRAGQGAS